MGAMATEDSPSHQKVAIWAPLGRHGDRKSPKESGGSPWRPPLQVATSFKQGKVATYGRHGDLDVASGDPFTLCRVVTYGRHGDLEVQVATSTQIALGRHLLDGEKDGSHGDLRIKPFYAPRVAIATK